MGLLRNYCNYKANSLLESVVALSIISVCLYIAVMVYSSVFTARTTARFYIEQNKINEFFFITQIQQDTLLEKFENDNWIITEEPEGKIKKITVKYKDSLQAYPEKSYYIANE
jgi:type II secretory pathway pseudopilin PulG